MTAACVYFVEGRCEEKLITALKQNPQRIMQGRVKVFNSVSEEFSMSQLLTIPQGSIVVLCFDTDVTVTTYLEHNIRLLRQYCPRVKIVFLMQVLNLEDELVRCTDIRNVRELTGSQSVSHFKRDFCNITNLRQVLDRHKLDVSRLWITKPPEEFRFIEADSQMIKKRG